MVEWPDWWSWELEFSPHLFKRMVDRDFNEADLRLMLERAMGYHEDVLIGRWVIDTEHESRPWEVIVEPDDAMNQLVVVTAYPVERISG